MAKQTSNIKEFEGELDSEVIKTVRRFVQLHKAIGLYTYRRIIDRSPVCTGRFRRNNNISVGEPDETIVPPADTDECTGTIRAPSLGEAQLRLVPLKPFDVIWINNPLPYAGALEWGHSKQAPEGVYEVALQDAEAKYDGVEI